MTKTEPIAIVGMSGIFPGSRDLDEFWHHLTQKTPAVSEVPPHRWTAPRDSMVHRDKRPDRAYSPWACLVSDAAADLTGIDIDPVLLQTLDPLYPLVLHTGKTALDQCRLTRISRDNIGVCLAAIVLPTDGATRITRHIRGRDFAQRLFGMNRISNLVECPPLSRNECLAANVAGFPAVLLAKALHLGGRAFTLDAACASSLYAVKLACDELEHRRADVMLAGGVSRPDALFTQVGFSQLQALSPSGRCAPFDENADGLVVGEGAGILALKRLSDACRDKDRVYGIIRGIGLSNDMRGNLLAPDSEGQVRAMRRAYAAAGWRPDAVDHIECHGAGTPVGDMVEVDSLMELWQDIPWRPGQCAIGSVKSAVGHLLTAAGAAGIIKTLLGFSHQTLPPSLNFVRPAKSSRLNDSPFQVQTDPAPWQTGKSHTPRRAAVSAFGFGGINAHFLLEEFPDSRTASPPHPSAGAQVLTASHHHVQPNDHPGDSPVAIIGMAARCGKLSSLAAFKEAVFRGEPAMGRRPGPRWKGCHALLGREYGLGELAGNFQEDFDLFFGDFHIPPKEIPDILPQQLLILDVAASAMRDAGMRTTEKRPDMSALVGIGFDFEATSFHLRWWLKERVHAWSRQHRLHLTDRELDGWLAQLMDEMGPPLTAARTIGDLGSIAASRVAREFKFGGPSFTVSNDEASGLTALEIGIRSLQRRETGAVLVGAVDLVGDAMNVVCRHHIRAFSASNRIRPFDRQADGTLPGEGAAAVVLKRLEDAATDGHRIYAVIHGTGSATDSAHAIDRIGESTYIRSMDRAFSESGVSPDGVGLIEAHGSGDPYEDAVEQQALHRYFDSRKTAAAAGAMGSTKSVIGHTGAAAGLFSVIKATLCLYHETIAPVAGYRQPAQPWDAEKFYLPTKAHYWLGDKKDGPRRALVCALTPYGGCTHVVMSGIDGICPGKATAQQMEQERKRPAGMMPWGLFAVYGRDRSELVENLGHLSEFVNTAEHEAIPLEAVAARWRRCGPGSRGAGPCVSIVTGNSSRLHQWISSAASAVHNHRELGITGSEGVCYTPAPLGPRSRMAFVFPGSGNHYVGMGREIGVLWPGILREMAAQTPSLKTQMLPHMYVPFRTSWESGWEKPAYDAITADPLHMIFGQVVYGGLMTRLLFRFGLRPDAVIGYSLGESAGYFALGAWPDREQMLERMTNTDLFSTMLAGPCESARDAWNIAPEAPFQWQVAVVNRPEKDVRRIIGRLPLARLLIVNTPEQCVIGGHTSHVRTAIDELSCEAVYLDGVVTVHCDAAKPAEKAYRALHEFPVTPPQGVTFYSCAQGAPLVLTTESAAESILQQALEGFDFTRTISRAYDDGIRIFLETGPHASCTGMIRSILKGRPHLAISASYRGEHAYLTLLKLFAALIANGVPVDMDALYGDAAYAPADPQAGKTDRDQRIPVQIGGPAPRPRLPNTGTERRDDPTPADRQPEFPVNPLGEPDVETPADIYRDIMAAIPGIHDATARAHETFLSLSSDIGKNQADAFALQNRLLEILMSHPDAGLDPSSVKTHAGLKAESASSPAAPSFSVNAAGDAEKIPPAFSREMCMEFAVGSVAKVLGPEFAEIDSYPKRVRLPDEPLMLVDRILSVEGEKGALGGGKIVTEHDVLPGAWYLDGGKAPVCISVEAGQADLFLCAYLGIDHRVKGTRAYRLLDATVEFHRGLPEPGDVIRYHIEIDRFVRQGDTYLFFFDFKGFIRNRPLITMTRGCAGFFTDEEIVNSGGILGEDHAPAPASAEAQRETFRPVACKSEPLSDAAVAALRKGDAAACFGPAFAGITIPEHLRLPDGAMKLIHRVLHMDPAGGKAGRGIVRAEADIHPDDWFLTCHFMDDMVMPGTLMYECCAHTLRIFLQHLGWIADTPGACYEPKPGVRAVLKCRGPVTPQTRRVHYEVEVKETGADPAPYAIADARMFADGLYIVRFQNLSMRLSNTTEEDVRAFWDKHDSHRPPHRPRSRLFDREDLVEFALGSPAKAFGPPYAPFERDRFIARLPNPPYLMMDRVVRCDPAPWELKPDGWVTAEYEVSPDHWYFDANRSDTMPFAVLMEVALQPCGWLAAYMGSALKSDKDLRFRNLDGNAVLHADVPRTRTTLTTDTRLRHVSRAGDMIIESFEFSVRNRQAVVYAGNTTFGFFTKEALDQQKGIRNEDRRRHSPSPEASNSGFLGKLEKMPPDFPGDPAGGVSATPPPSPSLPSKALLMIDDIIAYLPDGGPCGLGYIRGRKDVDPNEWFFKAHFFQDPVCPGSLGIESFLQLLKFVALDRWNGLTNFTRFEMIHGKEHAWSYRGQIMPGSKQVAVEAFVTEILESPFPAIMADGFLTVDGMVIYQMKNFGIRAVE